MENIGLPGAPPARRTAVRGALAAPAALALLAGIDAGLVLLGLPAPVTTERLPEVHGVLMVLGFVGTLIALERAVALRRRIGLLAPGLLGAGVVATLSPLPLTAGRSLLVAGAAALVAIYVPLWRRQRDDAVLVQILGAVLALGAAVLWLGDVPVATLLPWLVGFVVLTIAGERLELARIVMGPSAGPLLVVQAVALCAAVTASLLWPETTVLLGIVLLVLVAWLVRHDIARRTVTGTGLPRFMAGCMLAGYAWLAVAGAVWLVAGPTSQGGPYDAVVHAVFLGFTVSMIMAHAPVILPAVLGRPLPYHPLLQLPAALLHVSLVIRIWGGDALGSHLAWQIGGAGNIAAVLLFAATAVWSATRPASAGPTTTRPTATRPTASRPTTAGSTS